MKKTNLLIFFMLISSAMNLKAIEIVDVELQLLIDISGSVSSSEYQLQMDGYKAAFESNNVQNAILNGTNGKLAVQLIMWSGSNQQEVMIDWTLIDTPASSNAFASTIDTLARPFSGMTAIGNAINYGYTLFSQNSFEGLSQVIDVSGDGTNNAGIAPENARDNAYGAGIDRINGIVITSNQSVIDEYRDNVVAGENSFLLAPETFEDFQASIETKITSEIQGVTPKGNLIVKVPEPSSFVLILAGFSLMFTRKYFLTKEIL